MITKSSGFTLLELLLVVAIIGILSAVGTVTYSGYVKSAKRTTAQNIVQQIGLAQTEEYSNSGSYVVNKQADESEDLSAEETRCNPTKSTSDALESGLFFGDDIITDKNDFEICVVGSVTSYKVIAAEHKGRDPIEYTGCEIIMLRNSLPEKVGC